MYDYGKLKSLNEDVITEMKLIIKEEGPAKLKRDIERLERLASQPDKSELCNLPNLDVLTIFLNIQNNTKYSYDEIASACQTLKKEINGWTLEKDGENLLVMESQTNYDGSLKHYKYLDTFSKLGFTPIFCDYIMSQIYICMYEFLKFKRDIAYTKKITQGMPYKNRIALINNKYAASDFAYFVSIAKKILSERVEEHERRIEIAKIRLKYTKEFDKALENGEIDDLIEMPSAWHQYLDPRVLEDLYDVIHQNMLKKYTSLEQQQKELEQKLNKSSLVRFIYDNNLNPYSLPQTTLETLESIPNILEYINFFTFLNIPLNNILTIYYKYLIQMNDDKLNTLRTLINQGILSKETIRHTPSIIDEYYLRLIANYEILKEIIDPTSIFYNDKILIQDSKYIRDILSILKEYNLSKNNYIFLLCNFEYIGIYDLMLEHEIPDYLFISICKTTNPLNTIKRILIYKNIDEPYTTSNNLLRKNLTIDSKFICPDEELDDYLPNFVEDMGLNFVSGNSINGIVDSSYVARLDEEYRVDDLYVIGNVNISRPKFLRNFESVNSNTSLIIPSLVSGSILDEREYHNLTSELKIHTLKK